jgi:hypothetical protein
MIADYQPDRYMWFDSDFDDLTFHDNCIHAFAFDTNANDLYYDIDYICKWVNPEPGEVPYKFWLAPATLIFANVSALDIVVQSFDPGMIVAEVERTLLAQDEAGAPPSWEWGVHLLNGSFDFYATGFTLHIRSAPQLRQDQALTFEERGGYSFARTHPDGGKYLAKGSESDVVGGTGTGVPYPHMHTPDGSCRPSLPGEDRV